MSHINLFCGRTVRSTHKLIPCQLSQGPRPRYLSQADPAVAACGPTGSRGRSVSVSSAELLEDAGRGPPDTFVRVRLPECLDSGPVIRVAGGLQGDHRVRTDIRVVVGEQFPQSRE